MSEADGVLLLHGIARRARSLKPLERRLSAAGYVTLNLDYPARSLSLAEIAEVIAPEVEALGRRTARLHIVTHSMGGLVARLYLTRRRPDRLGRVVMLGPPNEGSEVADALHRFSLYRRFFGPAGAELVTTPWAGLPSPFGPVDYPLGIIAGCRSLYPLEPCPTTLGRFTPLSPCCDALSSDEPETTSSESALASLLLPGPGDGRVTVARTRLEGMSDHLVLPVAHPTMIWNRRLGDEVLHFLREGRFSRTAILDGDDRASSPFAPAIAEGRSSVGLDERAHRR